MRSEPVIKSNDSGFKNIEEISKAIIKSMQSKELILLTLNVNGVLLKLKVIAIDVFKDYIIFLSKDRTTMHYISIHQIEKANVL